MLVLNPFVRQSLVFLSTTTTSPLFGTHDTAAAVAFNSPPPAGTQTFWVCGEVLIDRLPALPAFITTNKKNQYDHNEEEQRRNVVGGGAANTATCLARLGYDQVQLIAGLSEDTHGKFAQVKLLENNINLDLSLQTSEEQPTCLATVTLDKNKQATYEFLIEDTATFAFNRTWLPEFTTQQTPNVVHIGTLATILEPGATHIYDWCFEGAVPAKIPIVYDPNIRPAVLNNRMHYQQSVEKFAALATVIKASDEDLAWLYPDEAYEEIAHRWLTSASPNNLTQLVVITRGAKGITAYTKNTKNGNTGTTTTTSTEFLTVVHAVPTRAMAVLDTVGAGDTVGAILTEGLVVHGIEKLVTDPTVLQAVMERANIAAGITCSREGCQPPSQLDLDTATQL